MWIECRIMKDLRTYSALMDIPVLEGTQMVDGSETIGSTLVSLTSDSM